METETGKEITSPGRSKATRSKTGTTGDVYKAEQGSGLEPGRKSATAPSEADRDDLKGEMRTADRVRDLGRRTVGRWEELTENVDRTVNENPMTAALTALGVGLVIGLVVGVLVARD